MEFGLRLVMMRRVRELSDVGSVLGVGGKRNSCRTKAFRRVREEPIRVEDAARTTDKALSRISWTTCGRDRGWICYG